MSTSKSSRKCRKISPLIFQLFLRKVRRLKKKKVREKPRRSQFARVSATA